MSLTIREIKTDKEKKAFIGLTRDLYKNDPNFIQPLDIERLESLDPKKNPFFDHARAGLFVAEQDGRLVGRISASYDDFAQEKWGPDLGYFGCFEAKSKDVADALLNAAKDWLKDQGAKTMQGPWSLSPKEEVGLLIDGFDTPPCFLMPHGKPEYEGWLTGFGLEKAHDVYAYQLDLTKPWPDKTRRIMDLAKKNAKLTLRELDTKRYDAEIALIVDIVTDAWSENWGFTPFTPDEGAHLASSLKFLLKPHRTVFAEYEGEAIGFMITLPDLNADIHDFNGKLFPTNIFKFLSRRILSKKEGRMRVPLMGVRKTMQAGKIGGLAALMMIDYSTVQVKSHGAYWGELGWILDTNEGMNNILVQIGCERYKTYRIFEKAI